MSKQSDSAQIGVQRRTRRLTGAVAPGPESDATQPADATKPADVLSEVLLADDPKSGLWQLVRSGWADKHLPELPALKLEQHPTLKHKDILAHTIKVTAQAPARLRVRLAALFHDIGKPDTREFSSDNVTFRNHEAVGAKMTRKRMTKLGYDRQMVDDVAHMVDMSGRFKGYDAGWTDSAVRRYARDMGPLLTDMLDLVRADCTSRHEHKVKALHASVDRFETHMKRLEAEEAAAALRAEIDGDRVMQHLGLSPGPEVGEAMRYLLSIRRDEGLLGEDEILRRLDAWWADRSCASDGIV